MAGNAPENLSLTSALSGDTDTGAGTAGASGAALPSIAGNSDFSDESVAITGQAGQVSAMAGLDPDRMRDAAQSIQAQGGLNGQGRRRGPRRPIRRIRRRWRIRRSFRRRRLWRRGIRWRAAEALAEEAAAEAAGAETSAASIPASRTAPSPGTEQLRLQRAAIRSARASRRSSRPTDRIASRSPS